MLSTKRGKNFQVSQKYFSISQLAGQFRAELVQDLKFDSQSQVSGCSRVAHGSWLGSSHDISSQSQSQCWQTRYDNTEQGFSV